MNHAPLVSIVIPACHPRFFKAALQSALEQTYEHLEILVCDDSQGDEIKQCVDALGESSLRTIAYVRNTRVLGFQRNLIKVVEQAQGEYIKVLCDDDRLFADCVTQQARVLAENDDVSLVLAQRFLNDGNDFVLPVRLENCRFCATDSLFKGSDILALLEGATKNFLGNFSSALMRRAELLKLLPALTQADAGFNALLDFALFACLLRHGNLVMLTSVLSAERLHPQRLSKQPDVLHAASQELAWFKHMLAARNVDAPPAAGWVRFVELAKASASARQWEELALLRVLVNLQTAFEFKVGKASESYVELYRDWLSCRQFGATQKCLLPQTIASWPSRPQIVPIVIDDSGDSADLQLTIERLFQQLYGPLTVVVLSDCAAVADPRVLQLPRQTDWVGQINGLLPQLEGADWFYLLRSGDSLSESALLVLAERIAAMPGIRCAYSDEGALVDGKSQEPVFKPGFNLDLMRAYPYVGRTLAFERQAVFELGGFNPDFGELAPHDVLWRLVEQRGPQCVEHIAQIQVESTQAFAGWLSLPELESLNARVLGAHLERIGVEHCVQRDHVPLINRVDYLHSQRPLVSIIIRAGDDLPALQRCVESLIEKTAYNCYEILLLDNPGNTPAIQGWLAAMAQLGAEMLRVLSSPQPLNDAALDNLGAAQARGEYLLLLSARSVIYSPRWLDELLNHAQRPEVGVVGARLLDAQGAVIHAGLVLGLQGPAGSPFVGEQASARGYLQRLQVVQDWSAVSGDCLMVRKVVFDSLGSLDDQSFSQGLSDLDLCLKVGKDGYLVVWTPHCNLLLAPPSTPFPVATQHAEKQREEEVFYQRWLPEIAREPAYNPSLSLSCSSFRLEPGLRSGWNPFCSRALPSILGLPINSTAVGHYRVSQPFASLEAAGRVVGRLSFENPTLVELERMKPDVIVFQGRYSEGPINELQRIKRYSSARRIFELDDYVVSAPKKNLHTRNKPANTESLLREGIALCDRVVVTTQPLAEALADMHHDIRVVPNMLAPELWSGLRGQRGTSSKPRVGWGGGTSHSGDLEVIAEVVRTLADQVEWVFFGMCPEDLRPYIHEFHPAVGLQAYPAKLASLNLDLALAPLEFHIFNDCKSNLRLLEYGACGFPVICTDTEAYRGYLPCTRVRDNSTAQWLEAITMHLADPAASYRMGDELREAVLRDFMLRSDNLQHWVWGWLAD